jgi:hypothetical protein
VGCLRTVADLRETAVGRESCALEGGDGTAALGLDHDGRRSHGIARMIVAAYEEAAAGPCTRPSASSSLGRFSVEVFPLTPPRPQDYASTARKLWAPMSATILTKHRSKEAIYEHLSYPRGLSYDYAECHR